MTAVPTPAIYAALSRFFAARMSLQRACACRLAAIAVGALAGALRHRDDRLAEFAHVVIYGIAFDERLCAHARISRWPRLRRSASAGSSSGLSTSGGRSARRARDRRSRSRPMRCAAAGFRCATGSSSSRRPCSPTGRRLGGAGGRLCADRLGDRLPGRRCARSPPAGFAHPRRLRRRGRDGRGLRRAADRRLLCVRADRRRLFAGQRRARAGCRRGGESDGAGRLAARPIRRARRLWPPSRCRIIVALVALGLVSAPSASRRCGRPRWSSALSGQPACRSGRARRSAAVSSRRSPR